MECQQLHPVKAAWARARWAGPSTPISLTLHPWRLSLIDMYPVHCDFAGHDVPQLKPSALPTCCCWGTPEAGRRSVQADPCIRTFVTAKNTPVTKAKVSCWARSVLVLSGLLLRCLRFQRVLAMHCLVHATCAVRSGRLCVAFSFTRTEAPCSATWETALLRPRYKYAPAQTPVPIL